MRCNLIRYVGYGCYPACSDIPMATVSLAPAYTPTYAEDTNASVRIAALKRGFCSIHNDIKIVTNKSLFSKSEFVQCSRCSQEFQMKFADIQSRLDLVGSDKSTELEAALLELNSLKATRDKELSDFSHLMNELEDERLKRGRLEVDLKVAENSVAVALENERLATKSINPGQNSELFEVKVCVVGESNTGKTSLSTQYCSGIFPIHSTPTIGSSFLCKRVFANNGQEISLQVWDTAGQERFQSMAYMYYRNCKAAIFVFDVTNEASFHSIPKWLRDLRAHSDPDCVYFLAANKSDKTATFDLTKCQAAADELGMKLFHTSALTGKGVSEMFESVTEALSEVYSKKKIKADSTGVILGTDESSKRGTRRPISGCC